MKKHNPIKWREHEVILVTVYCLLGVAGAWWKIFEYTGVEQRQQWGSNFTEHHLYFDFFINYLLPETGLLIAFYLAYVWMNLYILPRLVQVDAAEPGSFRVAFTLRARIEVSGTAGETLKRFLWGMINAIVLTVLLGAIWGVVIYYQRQFDYIGWDWTSTANRVLGLGWTRSAGLVLMYIAYGFVREWSIRRLTTDARRNAFRISLLNQLTTYTTVWLIIGCVLFFFDVIDYDPGFYFTFFGVIPALVLAGFTNVYWVFPLVGEGRFFRWMVLRRLFWTTLAWSFPAPILIMPTAHMLPPAILSIWMGQLFVITPLSWIIFQRRKDKIMELRGLQQALGKSEADLQFLRSQINPHFLFNALNTLYGTALQEEAAKTAGGIQQLGDMMRFMLHDNHQDKIPMGKEVEYLKNYIALQRLRTDSSPLIRIETAIDEVLPDAMIAPMLLIPFVENAFKHGISLREPSWVNIRLNAEGKKMLFEIRNSVHVRGVNDPEKDKSGVGLKNVLHRLNLLYPARHAFFVNQDEREFFVQLMIEP
ncbi:sensor histidine kinase [Puia sp.]|uniref:sensor histidine kinase n=1 Tax=Puia sp. TaxID=2045100 RepID=UPI002F423C60